MNSDLLQMIQRTVPAVTAADLERPIGDAGIDSMDMVEVRVTLEKHFGREVPDEVWFGFSTLNEAWRFFTTHAGGQKPQRTTQKKIGMAKRVEIGMPQMTNSTLSENWLLKEMGDLHWKMLSEGLAQRSSAFRDETGNRLYATFIRINYNINCLPCFQENDTLLFSGEIERFGSATYLSRIKGECGENSIFATLMTTFTVRTADDNSRIEKSKPLEKVNHVEEVNGIPAFLSEYRLLRKNLTDTWQLADYSFPVADEVLFECHYTLNPYYEINGVGLLYFAAYPVISDSCLAFFYKERKGMDDWVKCFHTKARDISYFANCNADDSILFQLNFFAEEENTIKTATTLYRQSDGMLLARIFTIKQNGNLI